MDGYDYGMLCEDVFRLRQDYPCVSVEEAGKSLCGRSLFLIGVGKGEPILIASCFHGMEHITAAVTMRLVRDLCSRYMLGENIGSYDAEEFFCRRRLFFVPCVNPDGVEISLHGTARAGEYAEMVERIACGKTDCWQANARGVDLNHNYCAEWEKLRKLEMEAGICGPAPTRFGGFFPNSEPETLAMVRLCERKKPRRVLACHSQGEEIYWKFGKNTPPGSYLLARKMAAVSGYRASEPEDALASYGGFKDWFIQQFGRIGLTVELGKGKNPLPLTDLPEIWRKARPLFFTFLTEDPSSFV